MPCTRDSDADLGWVIDQIKRITSGYDGFDDRIAALENLYKNLPDLISQEVAKQLIPTVDKVNSIHNSVKDLNDKVLAIQNALDSSLDHVNSQIQSIRDFVSYQTSLMQSWVIQKLESFSKELPPVICPVDGVLHNMQQVLYDMYNNPNFGIAVRCFDSMQNVVLDFDSKNWTIYYFDRFAGLYYYVKSYTWMISPISGEYMDSRLVINQLANLHKNGVHVLEFDSKMITVNAFDSMDLTVKTVDWTRDWFYNIA